MGESDNEHKSLLNNKLELGFIAHEIQEWYPYLVNGEKDGVDYQRLNYIALIPLLVKEIKELKKAIQKM